MRIRIFLFIPFLAVFSCKPDNVLPDAHFTCIPPEGNINTLFDLDATPSADPDGLKFLLDYRWDYDGDGQWDTPFGPFKITSCRFPEPGTFTVRVEVRDSYNGLSTASCEVFVDSLHRITDPRDGQVYPVVRIGSYWWFGRNLNVGKEVDPLHPADSGEIEKYVYPAEDPGSLNGGLYTWSEMMRGGFVAGSQGICPPGWHVPIDEDWRNMLSVFRSSAIRPIPSYWIHGEKFVPDQPVTHDNYQSIGAVRRLMRETGSTGFDAVMLGYRDPDGSFNDRDYHFPGHTATFWTSTISGDYAVRVRLYQTENLDGDIFRFADNRKYAFSVRCVKPTL